MGFSLGNAASGVSPLSRFQFYILNRDRYLELCAKYSLEPYDLKMEDLIFAEFDTLEDKVLLVNLILNISGLEQELYNVIDDPLFPKSICEAAAGYTLSRAAH